MPEISPPAAQRDEKGFYIRQLFYELYPHRPLPRHDFRIVIRRHISHSIF